VVIVIMGSVAFATRVESPGAAYVRATPQRTAVVATRCVPLHAGRLAQEPKCATTAGPFTLLADSDRSQVSPR
jgi:hypothetical protein